MSKNSLILVSLVSPLCSNSGLDLNKCGLILNGTNPIQSKLYIYNWLSFVVFIFIPAILLPAEVPKIGLPDFTFSDKTDIKFSSCKVFTRKSISATCKKNFFSFTADFIPRIHVILFTLILICSKKISAICVYSSCVKFRFGLERNKDNFVYSMNNSAISSLIYSKYFPPKVKR